jgi:hypothetical protein
MKCLPVWDEEAGTIDMVYWLFGSLALHQRGGEDWDRWRDEVEKAILPHQRKEGPLKGSWDPIGVWGADGGRVYSTAVLTLTLQTYRRYPRLFTGRTTRGKRRVR